MDAEVFDELAELAAQATQKDSGLRIDAEEFLNSFKQLLLVCRWEGDSLFGLVGIDRRMAWEE